MRPIHKSDSDCTYSCPFKAPHPTPQPLQARPQNFEASSIITQTHKGTLSNTSPCKHNNLFSQHNPRIERVSKMLQLSMDSHETANSSEPIKVKGWICCHCNSRILNSNSPEKCPFWRCKQDGVVHSRCKYCNLWRP